MNSGSSGGGSESQDDEAVRRVSTASLQDPQVQLRNINSGESTVEVQEIRDDLSEGNMVSDGRREWIESQRISPPALQIPLDFSKVPRVPGDGAYAMDEDIEAQTQTQICITPAPKLKPLQFESVVVVPENSCPLPNTLSPSTIKHSAIDPVNNSQQHLRPNGEVLAHGPPVDGESATII